MLIIFKYTSKQSAIAAVRRQIKANLLALKLFKDKCASGAGLAAAHSSALGACCCLRSCRWP